MRLLVLAALAVTIGCNRVSGQLIEGRGGSARKAANVGVSLIANVDRYYDRCTMLHALSDTIRLKRGAHKDSVFRANEARVRGDSRRYQALMAAINGGNFGDPATPYLARWKKVDSMYPIKVAWHGVTDGDGRFKSKLLSPGRYLLRSGFSGEVVEHKFFGTRVQAEYLDFNVTATCDLSDGRSLGW